MRCPLETYTGLTPTRVRNTAPTISPLCIKGCQLPRVSGNSSCFPTSNDLATPILGIFTMTPRWQAIPNRRGWAIP